MHACLSVPGDDTPRRIVGNGGGQLVQSGTNTVQACHEERPLMHAYFLGGVFVAGLVTLSRVALAVIALCRADKKDIPAIVRGLAHWWHK